MLKYGFLASNSLYLSTFHSKKIMDSYLFYLEKVFKMIKDCEKTGNIKDYLKGPVCKTHFKRLN